MLLPVPVEYAPAGHPFSNAHAELPVPFANRPATHAAQLVDPADPAKLPAPQASHAVLPSPVANVPAGHAAQRRVSRSIRPGGHCEHTDADVGLVLPTGHCSQTLLPLTFVKLPALHDRQTSPVAPTVTEYVPIEQVPAHALAPIFVLNEPAAHRMQVADEAPPLAVEYDPAAQPTHADAPTVGPKDPAAHSPHAAPVKNVPSAHGT